MAPAPQRSVVGSSRTPAATRCGSRSARWASGWSSHGIAGRPRLRADCHAVARLRPDRLPHRGCWTTPAPTGCSGSGSRCDLPGALPVTEVAASVVGRGFALPDVDAAEAPWTLDNPANTWFGARLDRAGRTAGSARATPLGDRAVGVAEVVVGGPRRRGQRPRPGRSRWPGSVSRATTSPAHWSTVRLARRRLQPPRLPDRARRPGRERARPRAAGPRSTPSTRPSSSASSTATGRVSCGCPRRSRCGRSGGRTPTCATSAALPALLVVGPVDDLVADLRDAAVEAVGLTGRRPNRSPTPRSRC